MKKKLRSKSKFIPVNVPKIFNQEKIDVKNCLNSGWISSEGQYVKKFENSFSKYNNRAYGIAVSSGSGALEIAVKALNLKPYPLFVSYLALNFPSLALIHLATIS